MQYFGFLYSVTGLDSLRYGSLFTPLQVSVRSVTDLAYSVTGLVYSVTGLAYSVMGLTNFLG